MRTSKVLGAYLEICFLSRAGCGRLLGATNRKLSVPPSGARAARAPPAALARQPRARGGRTLAAGHPARAGGAWWGGAGSRPAG